MTTTEDYYRKRYESAMEAIVALQHAVDEARRENGQLMLEKLRWQAQQATQQQVIVQAIAQANATSNSYLEENKRLKQELDQHHCAGCDGGDGG